MQQIIEVKNLSKRFGEHIILDDISFDVEEGSIFGLIGKSGCGKTTLLNMIVGFLKPNRGTVLYRGNDLAHAHADTKKNLGFAVQEGSFYKKLTVEENLAYFGRLYGLANKDIKHRTSTLLETFGLQDANIVFGENLSVGMQKRLDIACSLIHDPEVLLLDEPTANLDPVLRKNILDLIKKINDSGTTVILSSHILEDINTLCSKVLVLNNKRVVAFDSPKNLELNFANHKIIKLQSEQSKYEEIISVLASQGLVKKYEAGEALMLFTTDVKSALKHINHYYGSGNDNLLHIDVVKPSLDAVFENLSN